MYNVMHVPLCVCTWHCTFTCVHVPFLCVDMYLYVYYLTIIILYRHHAWTSFQASAEIYNELICSTDNQNAKNLSMFFEDDSNCLNGEGKD